MADPHVTAISETGIPKIDHDAVLTAEDKNLLINHGWELSDDEREARLYSEEWSSAQAAVFSTKWWVDQCQDRRNQGLN